ncbi:minor capsid protein [Latilactobacillus sakei]|uniref:minor capsid protein n=1 Tax=Latilactobacillus sakei TaxID=1599 RepID=UPI003A83E5B0
MKVKVDLSGVRKKMSAANFKRGQFAMANQAMADMNKFVPKRENRLRNSAHVDSGGQFVVWNAPYAERQYRGVGIHNYTTPGTGPRWDLKAKGMYLNSWVDAFKKGAKL